MCSRPPASFYSGQIPRWLSAAAPVVPDPEDEALTGGRVRLPPVDSGQVSILPVEEGEVAAPSDGTLADLGSSVRSGALDVLKKIGTAGSDALTGQVIPAVVKTIVDGILGRLIGKKDKAAIGQEVEGGAGIIGGALLRHGFKNINEAAIKSALIKHHRSPGPPQLVYDQIARAIF